MRTNVLKVDNENFEQVCESAAKLLKAGDVVAIPTETVYGLASSAFNDNAVRHIFEIKGRPQDNPLIVHISDYVMLNDVASDISDDALNLARRFWPGPLTMVLKKTDAVSDVVTCGGDTVAVRMPSHPIAAEIIRVSGLPLAAPSANLSGKPSPTTADHCIDDLTGKVSLIVDGGKCDVGVESTVISLVGETPILLRPGIISIDEIREVLPNAEVSKAIFEGVKTGEKVLSPGMKYKHYSPNADVILVDSTLEQFVQYVDDHNDDGVVAMCFDGEQEDVHVTSIAYGPEGNGAVQSQKVFSVLRAIDKIGAKTIYVRCPQQDGVSMAVFNRLIRAAGFKVIKL